MFDSFESAYKAMKKMSEKVDRALKTLQITWIQATFLTFKETRRWVKTQESLWHSVKNMNRRPVLGQAGWKIYKSSGDTFKLFLIYL